MSSPLPRILFHGSTLVHHTYAAWTSFSLSGIKHEDPFVTSALDFGTRYLTYWNLSFQMLFLAVSLRCDVAEWTDQKISSRWRSLRETIFHGLVFPFTLYVFTLFWSLYLWDREYVYPRVVDTVMPCWLNHSVHSSILGVLALEMLLQRRPPPGSASYYLLIVVVHLYSIVYHATYLVHGVWLYPFYRFLSWPLIVLWYFKFLLCLHGFYLVQTPLFRYLSREHATTGQRNRVQAG